MANRYTSKQLKDMANKVLQAEKYDSEKALIFYMTVNIRTGLPQSKIKRNVQQLAKTGTLV